MRYKFTATRVIYLRFLLRQCLVDAYMYVVLYPEKRGNELLIHLSDSGFREEATVEKVRAAKNRYKVRRLCNSTLCAQCKSIPLLNGP